MPCHNFQLLPFSPSALLRNCRNKWDSYGAFFYPSLRIHFVHSSINLHLRKRNVHFLCMELGSSTCFHAWFRLGFSRRNPHSFSLVIIPASSRAIYFNTPSTTYKPHYTWQNATGCNKSSCRCHWFLDHSTTIFLFQLSLTKHHAMETYWGNGCIAPRILSSPRH